MPMRFVQNRIVQLYISGVIKTPHIIIMYNVFSGTVDTGLYFIRIQTTELK